MRRESANCKLQIANCKLRGKRENPAERSFRHPSPFAIYDPIGQPNGGFTLVELLVVITIIGILLAILIPGVNMARELSRQSACMNNQKEIGTAILAYDVAKRHLPGVLNHSSFGGPAVSFNWVEAILPDLDRRDLFNLIVSGSAASPTLQVKVAICPDDPYLIDPTSPNFQALLSYGVNDGFFASYDVSCSSSTPPPSPPVDRGCNSVAPAVLSNLTARPVKVTDRGQPASLSTTIMLGERTGDGTSNYPRAGSSTYPTAGKWTDAPPLVAATKAWDSLTFKWPVTATAISPGIMVSCHPGKVIVVFFDGHSEKVDTSTTYPQ